MPKIAEIVKDKGGYANFVQLRSAFQEDTENTDRMAMYRPTGLQIMVPLFIANGDIIRVDTAGKKYLGKE